MHAAIMHTVLLTAVEVEFDTLERLQKKNVKSRFFYSPH